MSAEGECSECCTVPVHGCVVFDSHPDARDSRWWAWSCFYLAGQSREGAVLAVLLHIRRSNPLGLLVKVLGCDFDRDSPEVVADSSSVPSSRRVMIADRNHDPCGPYTRLWPQAVPVDGHSGSSRPSAMRSGSGLRSAEEG